MMRILAALLLLPALACGAIDVEHMVWDRYYDQEEMVETLQALHRAHPDLTELASLGRSEEGRDIWCLTINNRATGPAASKPAIYVDGAIHGNEIQATEVCLYLAWHLLDKYGKWDRISELVDRVAFLIVPTVNVDSRARFFADPNSFQIGRTARVPYDDDHDGLADEDDYDDLDDDGQILTMRIHDPHGTHRSDPDDPRVMLQVKPGEQGEWRMLGREGLDNDGDGRVNEDVPGYLDMNRNWGFLWQPGYVQEGSGDYPFCARDTEAIAAFLRDRTNLVFGFNFHNYGGMILRGPGSDLSPPIPPGDLAVFDYLGEEGERVLPGYRYLIASQDLYTTHGDFDEWMYQCLGAYSFVAELTMSSQFSYLGESDDAGDGVWSRHPSLAERQKFNDALMAGELFSDWRPFTHPTYGEIEIGGWRTFSTRIPPPFMMPEMLHRNAMFVVWTAMQAPRLELEVFEVADLGGGLRRVRARAANAGAMPTLSDRARGKRINPLDRFTIAGKGLTVHSGGVLRDAHFGTVDAVEHHPETVPTWVDGFGAREVQWIVTGSGTAIVEYAGVKCGTRSVEIRLP
jgi:hypothetical protein